MLIFEKDLPKKLDYLELWYILCNMGKSINKFYVYELFTNAKNHLVLYSIDNTKVDIKNCPCGLIYTIVKNENENEINIYIMFIATEYRYRKVGYASIFINEFITFIKEKYGKKFKNISIILDSIETAVTFYEQFGFKWTTTEDKHNSIFNIDETNVNEHFIMVYK